jgi:hypothetical protein
VEFESIEEYRLDTVDRMWIMMMVLNTPFEDLFCKFEDAKPEM